MKEERADIIGDIGLTTREATGHNFKSFFFADLFNNEKRAIELFNLFESENLPENTKVVLCNEELSQLLALRNDLAFVIEDKFIIVSEHQSTLNKNMPLRILQYFTNILYTIALGEGSVYDPELIKLPTPKFYVAYNGQGDPGKTVLRLSDAYIDKSKGFSLEVEAQIFDIRYERFSGSEQDKIFAPEKHSSVLGYSFLVHEIHRNLSNGINRDQAIKLAVGQCLQEHILTEYLEKTGLEVVLKMLNYEYNHADELNFREQKGIEKGIEKGAEKKSKEVARKMLNKGMDVHLISQLIELSEVEIEKLRAEI